MLTQIYMQSQQHTMFNYSPQPTTLKVAYSWILLLIIHPTTCFHKFWKEKEAGKDEICYNKTALNLRINKWIWKL